MKEAIYSLKIVTGCSDVLTPDEILEVLGKGGLLVDPNQQTLEVTLVQIRDTDPREEG